MLYKSKIAKGMVSILIVIYTACSLIMLFDDSWPGILVITPAFALVGYAVATTYYVIEGKILRVRSGLFYNKVFDIKIFRKVVKTNSAITAPAASLDRLELFFNSYDSVVISPKDKDAFIAHILSLNSGIIYEG